MSSMYVSLSSLYVVSADILFIRLCITVTKGLRSKDRILAQLALAEASKTLGLELENALVMFYLLLMLYISTLACNNRTRKRS